MGRLSWIAQMAPMQHTHPRRGGAGGAARRREGALTARRASEAEARTAWRRWGGKGRERLSPRASAGRTAPDTLTGVQGC